MAAQAIQQVTNPQTSVTLSEPQLTQEQIAALAYTLWQHRGCPDGSPDEDWFRAENELLARAEA